MPENTITIVGNVSRDPELRFTPSGQAVANFSVAVSRRKKNGDQWEDVLEGFFNCIAWRNMAENVAESLAKGDRVIVTGKLQQRSWEDKNGGGKRSAVEVQVDDVGPSLKWATATTEKASRSSGGGSGGSDWGAPPGGSGGW